jgi:hypothetical protein
MSTEVSHRFTCNEFEGSYKAAMNELDVCVVLDISEDTIASL